MPETQNYASHTRWLPLWHFIAAPITLAYFINAVVQVFRHPERAIVIQAIFAFGVFAGVFASRLMAVTVQDRLIRLEMRLRLKEVLPAALFSRFDELNIRQLVALRFASNAEMPALVERVLKGELVKEKAIKQAVRDWQGDYLRA